MTRILAVSDSHGYVAGLDFITREVLENCPNLKVVSRYGVGCDRVDLEAARELKRQTKTD